MSSFTCVVLFDVEDGEGSYALLFDTEDGEGLYAQKVAAKACVVYEVASRACPVTSFPCVVFFDSGILKKSLSESDPNVEGEAKTKA